MQIFLLLDHTGAVKSPLLFRIIGIPPGETKVFQNFILGLKRNYKPITSQNLSIAGPCNPVDVASNSFLATETESERKERFAKYQILISETDTNNTYADDVICSGINL